MRAALVLALLIVASAFAAASTSVRVPGQSAFSRAAPIVPVVLARGAAGTAAIGANATASSDAMTGGVGATTSSNGTSVRNAAGYDVQVRLAFRATNGGAVAQCAKCDLQIRNASATTAEINVDGSAPAAGVAGAWVTLRAGATCWIWAVGQANLVADTQVGVLYVLEIQPLPATGTPITLRYVDMQEAFTV